MADLDRSSGYEAQYEGREYRWYLPVVTHSVNGVAMVYNDDGRLVEASSLPFFRGVRPASVHIYKKPER